MNPGEERAGSAQVLRRLAVRRDSEAWVCLLALHGRDILGVSRRILKDPHLAEDACQETLLRLRDQAGRFQAPREGDAERAARNWILTVAGHTALQILRSRRRAQRHAEAQPRETENVSMEQPSAEEAERSQLLQSMGMKRAFIDGNADFSGMNGGKERLHISAVLHKGFVEVNEEGTEAAAATGIGIPAARDVERHTVFRADHPFLFLIRDTRNGALLFMGRLMDPRE